MIGMNAIVIMAKEPEPNKVKTRLIPALDPISASKIYKAFLMDRIHQIKEISDVDSFIAYTPQSAESFFKEIAPENFILIPQEGNDLGERLSNVSYELFERGYQKIVIMDSDSPNLPSRYITSSFYHLDETDVVLGPTEDGGYYLVGLSRHAPGIFKDIPWSTSEVMEITKKRAIKGGRSIHMLEKWYDVDTKEDLIRLKNELEKESEQVNDMNFCTNTFKIVSEIDIKNKNLQKEESSK
jgi:rSAM/selenodomain-associated transferase 1